MIRLKVLLHEMSWKEAKQYFAGNDLAILPVGSNEQHGPPNPLGTDHLIAKGIAEEVAKRTGVACLQESLACRSRLLAGVACLQESLACR